MPYLTADDADVLAGFLRLLNDSFVQTGLYLDCNDVDIRSAEGQPLGSLQYDDDDGYQAVSG